MVKRTTEIAKWCKLIAALGVCASIACSKQILPQLIAQLASLDHDHGVSLHATSDGVDLVLTHNDHSFPENDKAQALALSAQKPAHVVHIMIGPTTAKQSASLMVSNARDLVPYCSTATVTEWRTFVPPLLLAYSRPPPDELSIPLVDRSTLLLI
ncbi:MAG: hypothetical protein DMF37_11710 [Verrucomicrobia bacterium]|nr:MAG: hypothetical protein DMF37_11710 [Verrucomicrobiota bacterium]